MATQCHKCGIEIPQGDVKCPRCGELYLEKNLAGGTAAVAATTPPPSQPVEEAPKIAVPLPPPPPTPTPRIAVPPPPSGAAEATKAAEISDAGNALRNILGDARKLREDLHLLKVSKASIMEEIEEHMAQSVKGRNQLWSLLILGTFAMSLIATWMIIDVQSRAKTMMSVLAYERFGDENAHLAAASSTAKKMDQIINNKIRPAFAELKTEIDRVTSLANIPRLSTQHSEASASGYHDKRRKVVVVEESETHTDNGPRPQVEEPKGGETVNGFDDGAAPETSLDVNSYEVPAAGKNEKQPEWH